MNINETSTKVILIGIVVLVGLLITGAVFWGAQTTTAPSVAVNIKDVKIDGAPYIGSVNAPVTIAEWFDYQCPLCKQFEIGTLPQVLKEYVDTGKVRIVFKSLAFLGNDSITGAEYDYAVWKLYPDKYVAWRTAMFNAQDQEGDQGFGDVTSVDKLNATIAGIDAAKVAADVKANAAKYQAAINEGKAEAQKFGINGTPSFVIGTQLIPGARPYATFKAAIDLLLK